MKAQAPSKEKIFKILINGFIYVIPLLFSLILIWIIYTIKVNNNIVWPLSMFIIFNVYLIICLYYTKIKMERTKRKIKKLKAPVNNELSNDNEPLAK